MAKTRQGRASWESKAFFAVGEQGKLVFSDSRQNSALKKRRGLSYPAKSAFNVENTMARMAAGNAKRFKLTSTAESLMRTIPNHAKTKARKRLNTDEGQHNSAAAECSLGLQVYRAARHSTAVYLYCTYP